MIPFSSLVTLKLINRPALTPASFLNVKRQTPFFVLFVSFVVSHYQSAVIDLWNGGIHAGRAEYVQADQKPRLPSSCASISMKELGI